MIFQGKDNEYVQLKSIGTETIELLANTRERCLTVLWFGSGENVLIIDGQERVFKKNEIVFFTEFHKVKPKRVGEVRFLKFNQDFYCVQDNDEIACKGILFFGAAELPVITIPEELVETLETIWTSFKIEILSGDHLQLKMLQMMLVKYLILCTRIYKKQAGYPKGKMDANIIREFNFLVEKNFKTKHSIAEYAELMNKSPKTISNVFSKISSKTPLQFIQLRKLLEARRLLQYSDKQVQEVAYEIGYTDIQTFSRFFKKSTGISPSKFKEAHA